MGRVDRLDARLSACIHACSCWADSWHSTRGTDERRVEMHRLVVSILLSCAIAHSSSAQELENEISYTCPDEVVIEYWGCGRLQCIDGAWINNFTTGPWTTGRSMNREMGFSHSRVSDNSCHQSIHPNEQDTGCLRCVYELNFLLEVPIPRTFGCTSEGKQFVCERSSRFSNWLPWNWPWPWN